MGLDIYVGSLTRYYSGDWALSTEAWAREMGMPFGILGDHPTKPDPKPSREHIRRGVLEWRRALGLQLDETLDWDESDRSPYLTDKPGYTGWNALQSWASDEARYPHLLKCGLWLPCEREGIYEGPDVFGDDRRMGSGPRLLWELQELNSRTWKADGSRLKELLSNLPADSKEWAACCAFREVLRLVEFADEHRLPMLLDY